LTVQSTASGTLNINDQGNANAVGYTISPTAVTTNAGATINYSVGTLTLNGSTGDDAFSVTGTGAGTTTVFTGGGSDSIAVQATTSGFVLNLVGGLAAGASGTGADTVTLGNNGSVQGIQGTVNIENPPSSDTITVDDSADSGARNVTFGTLSPNPADSEGNNDSYGPIVGLAPGQINYEDADTTALTVDGGSGNNTYTVNHTTDFSPTTINSGSGNDSFTIAGSGLGNSSTNNFNGQGGNDTFTVNGPTASSATTNINGGTGNSSVNYNANGGNATITPTGPNSGTITQPGGGTVNYTNVPNVNLAPASGDITITDNGTGDHLTVTATDHNSGSYVLVHGATTIQSGTFSGISSFTYNAPNGSDTLTIDNQAGGLFAPANGIAFNGGTGGNALEDLGGSATSGSFTPNPTGAPQNAGTVTHTNATDTQTITFTGLSPHTDTVSEPTFTVNATDDPGTITYQDGGIASDGTQLNTVTDTAPGVEAVSFGNKTNVIVNSDATAAGAAKTEFVQFSTPATGLTNLTFDDNGGGTSGFAIKATPAAVSTTVTGSAAGHDGVFISDPQSKLDQILGPVTFNGSGIGNQVALTDTGSTVPYTYTVTDTTISRSGGAVTPGTVTYSDMSTVTLSAANATGGLGNTIDITALANNAVYTINAGSGDDSITAINTLATPAGGTALTVNGQLGADTFTVDFSGASSPIPTPPNGTAAGITFHGGGNAGDTLDIANLTATTVTENFLPDAGGGHAGNIAIDSDPLIAYDGLQPVNMTGSTVGNLVFNLPTTAADNMAILEKGTAPAGESQIDSGSNTFETTTFPNPTTSLTVNAGSTGGDTVTVRALDAGFAAPITVNGTANPDRFVLDYINGNPVPTGGVTFSGGADNGDALTLINAAAGGFSAATDTHTFTDANSGSIQIDALGPIAYSGLSQALGVSDDVPSANRVFNFPKGVVNVVTLGALPPAGAGFSGISSTSTSPSDVFRNPTGTLTVNLGDQGDTITAGPAGLRRRRQPRAPAHGHAQRRRRQRRLQRDAHDERHHLGRQRRAAGRGAARRHAERHAGRLHGRVPDHHRHRPGGRRRRQLHVRQLQPGQLHQHRDAGSVRGRRQRRQGGQHADPRLAGELGRHGSPGHARHLHGHGDQHRRARRRPGHGHRHPAGADRPDHRQLDLHGHARLGLRQRRLGPRRRRQHRGRGGRPRRGRHGHVHHHGAHPVVGPGGPDDQHRHHHDAARRHQHRHDLRPRHHHADAVRQPGRHQDRRHHRHRRVQRDLHPHGHEHRPQRQPQRQPRRRHPGQHHLRVRVARLRQPGHVHARHAARGAAGRRHLQRHVDAGRRAGRLPDRAARQRQHA
jgi:hypothetical protein